MEVREGAIDYCHMAVIGPRSGCPPAAHLDPIRQLAKLLSRGIVKGVEELDEMRVSTFSLVKRYRDPAQAASCADAAFHVHGYEHRQTLAAIRLLFKFCNTPSKKLFVMADEKTSHPIEYDVD